MIGFVDRDRPRLDAAGAKRGTEPAFSHHRSPAYRNQQDIGPTRPDERLSGGRVLPRNDEQVGRLTDGNLASIRKLQHTRGDKNLAARLLGIATRTIYRHLEKHEELEDEIKSEAEDFRQSQSEANHPADYD